MIDQLPAIQSRPDGYHQNTPTPRGIEAIVVDSHAVARTVILLLGFAFIWTSVLPQEMPVGTIDRQLVVSRHNITLKNLSSEGPTQVGNGHLAYGFDISGLQTFNASFTTMSDWGWHSFPLPPGTSASSFRRTLVNTHGRMVPYDLPNDEQSELSEWLEGNPHKFNLGRIGLVLKKKDGTDSSLSDLHNARQYIDLWTGIVDSSFDIEGQAVKVTTVCGNKDVISFRIESALLKSGRLSIFVEFPYAARGSVGNGSDYGSPTLHQTTMVINYDSSVTFRRKLDNTTYWVAGKWTGHGRIAQQRAHRYVISSRDNEASAEYTFEFAHCRINYAVPSFSAVESQSISRWSTFWREGGAIDLSGSKDQRWFELERRIVLSQYVMAINAAGNYPPGESGLVTNNWYNRFHYEMYWWHEAHYALWDRWNILNRSLHVYADNLGSSEMRARSQGYNGARWPKCTGPNGREWPHPVHAWLIWQEPHPIFFAELDFRAHPNVQTLKKWRDIVGKTADFMASYAFLDQARGQYVLGPPLYVVSENDDPLTTMDPTFELAYWRFGLQTARDWWSRSGLKPKSTWGKVEESLAPLPVSAGLYEQWENIQDMWTRFNYEHPSVIGAYGMLPGLGVNKNIMERTFQKVQSVWRYDDMWGWDFGMLAMSAARLGHPENAVDLLLYPSRKFGFDEHGYVGGGNPYPYFPSNGSLLYAVAMMAAGWEGDGGVKEPGWPKNGSWVIRWEGLKQAP